MGGKTTECVNNAMDYSLDHNYCLIGSLACMVNLFGQLSCLLIEMTTVSATQISLFLRQPNGNLMVDFFIRAASICRCVRKGVEWVDSFIAWQMLHVGQWP